MEFNQFILEQLLPLTAALYVLGLILKNTMLIKDKYIPIALLVLGIAGAFGILTITNKVDITTAIIQGILATGVAVLTNQTYKQLKKEEWSNV